MIKYFINSRYIVRYYNLIVFLVHNGCMDTTYQNTFDNDSKHESHNRCAEVIVKLINIRIIYIGTA